MRVLAVSLLAACELVLGACGEDEPDEPAPATTTSVADEAPAVPDAADPADENAGVEDDVGAEDAGDDAEDDGEAEENEAAEAESPDDDGDQPRSVEEVITAVFTDAGSPEEACDELVTDSFVRDAYGAPQGCHAARAPRALASRVKVAKLRESGDEATAVVTPDGGVYDGIEVDVTLIADPDVPGSWLLASLVADVPAGP